MFRDAYIEKISDFEARIEMAYCLRRNWENKLNEAKKIIELGPEKIESYKEEEEKAIKEMNEYAKKYWKEREGKNWDGSFLKTKDVDYEE